MLSSTTPDLTTKSIDLLILQPTQYCNMGCTYCFIPPASKDKHMSGDVLNNVASKIVGSDFLRDGSIILWHDGEPLTVSQEWYRAAYQLFKKSTDKSFRFQFQTNATLIDDKWAELFKETHADIGISVDGPEEVHNLYRKDKNGAGAFSRVMAGVDVLKKHNIPFSVLSTITRDSLDKVDEIYDFMLDLRPQKWGLCIEKMEGANKGSSVYHDEAIQKVEDFLYNLSNRNFVEQNALRIREIDSTIGLLLHPPSELGRYSQESYLGSIVSVGQTGNVAFFSPEMLTSSSVHGNGIVGNITESSLSELFDHEKTKQIQSAIWSGAQLCKDSCDYFDFCGGGSPSIKLTEHGRFDVSETWFCRLTNKAITRGVLRAISEQQLTPN